MTRLLKVLVSGTLLLSAWLALLLGYIPVKVTSEMREVLIPLPLYLLVVFGCYSLFIIGYRVSTFNDCTEAAESLKKEISEAREDLKKKGLNIE